MPPTPTPTPNMSISVNGQCQVPPGFRFHPTEEELLQYYLRKKVSNQNIDLDVIRHVDLNKLEPWDIQEKCKIGTTPQNEWYLFSHKDKKYPSGSRTNRATAVGFWKATGRDKVIYSNAKRIGMRKTLVFYKGRAPHGQKSDWIMHEYRLDDSHTNTSAMGDRAQEEGWVVCRIFKKKHHHSATSIAEENGRSQMVDSYEEGGLEQLGRDYNDDRLLQLPSLESPKSMTQQNNNNNNEVSFTLTHNLQLVDPTVNGGVSDTGGLTKWETLDRLVASQLNGQTDEEAFRQFASFSTDPTVAYNYTGNGEQLLPTISSTTTHTSAASYSYITPTIQEQDYTSSGIHLWNFAPSTCSFLSTSEPLSHVSNTSM